MIMRFQPLIWLFPFALALLEAEEWNIFAWYQRNFIGLPPERTRTTIRFFLVFLSILGFIWTAIAFSWENPTKTAMILFPLVALILQNILQHVYWQILFRQYAPGIITSIFLLVPLVFGFLYWVLTKSNVPVWYIILFGVLIIPGLIQTVKFRNRLTTAIYYIHKFSLFAVKNLVMKNH
jgi:hypothetical protein